MRVCFGRFYHCGGKMTSIKVLLLLAVAMRYVSSESDLRLRLDQYKMLHGPTVNVGTKQEVKREHKGQSSDMLMTEEQYNMLFGSDSGRSKRKAIKGDKYRWTNNTIPYEFKKDHFWPYQEKEIKQAMDMYMEETCIKFEKVDPCIPSDHKNKVVFQNGDGCSAQLGMKGGVQGVYLDWKNCRWMGLYLHEIGHTIGLVHEHQLPDRDKYVKIHLENVEPDVTSEFKLYREDELERFGVPYDFSSVMHYSTLAFSKDGKSETIVPHDSSKRNQLFTTYKKMLSFTDVKLVNLMYKCSAHCGNVNCPGEGFLDKNCKCVTPQSYYDKHCYNIQGNDQECQGWAKTGECDANPGWMSHNCRKACDRCPKYGVNPIASYEDSYVEKPRPNDMPDPAVSPESYINRGDENTDYVAQTSNDMILSQEQYSILFGKGDRLTKRKAFNDERFRWTNKTIPYRFLEEHFWPYQEKEMKQAMDVFMKETCLIFKPYDECAPEDKNHIVIQNGNGCSAELGMTRNGAQGVYLSHQGCRWMGLYFHEFGHAIGLVHEHQLPDRDQHITIHFDEVDPELVSNFKMYTADKVNTFNIPYDYSSVMHYDVKAFSKDGKSITITARDKSKESQISEPWIKMLSFSDVKTINLMYRCNEKCGHVNCPPEGFIDKHCKCITPQSYYDSHCVNLNGDDAKCDEWARTGECDANKGWMSYNCRKSCDRCSKFGIEEKAVVTDAPTKPPTTQKPKPVDCVDQRKDCPFWARDGHCQSNPVTVPQLCPLSCGVCSTTPTKAPVPVTDKPVVEKCDDSRTDCPSLAENGRCNDADIFVKCRYSCGVCEDNPTRPPVKPTNPPVTQPPTKTPDQIDCVDQNVDCRLWARDGHCISNPVTVPRLCPRSCGVCKSTATTKPCIDQRKDCHLWARDGHCQSNPVTVPKLCPKSCNTCG